MGSYVPRDKDDSIIEQLKIIEPLTDPTAYGGSAADAFDDMIPSMPCSDSPASRPSPAGVRIASHGPGWSCSAYTPSSPARFRPMTRPPLR